MQLLLRLVAWYWARRLSNARRYREVIERECERERAGAVDELHYCETMLARAEARAIARRADKVLKARQRSLW